MDKMLKENRISKKLKIAIIVMVVLNIITFNSAVAAPVTKDPQKSVFKCMWEGGENFLTFLEATFGAITLEDLWAPWYDALFRNSCHVEDILSVMMKRDQVKEAIRDNYLTCRMEKIPRLKLAFAKANAELYYIRNVLDWGWAISTPYGLKQANLGAGFNSDTTLYDEIKAKYGNQISDLKNVEADEYYFKADEYVKQSQLLEMEVTANNEKAVANEQSAQALLNEASAETDSNSKADLTTEATQLKQESAALKQSASDSQKEADKLKQQAADTKKIGDDLKKQATAANTFDVFFKELQIKYYERKPDYVLCPNSSWADVKKKWDEFVKFFTEDFGGAKAGMTDWKRRVEKLNDIGGDLLTEEGWKNLALSKLQFNARSDDGSFNVSGDLGSAEGNVGGYSFNTNEDTSSGNVSTKKSLCDFSILNQEDTGVQQLVDLSDSTKSFSKDLFVKPQWGKFMNTFASREAMKKCLETTNTQNIETYLNSVTQSDNIINIAQDLEPVASRFELLYKSASQSTLNKVLGELNSLNNSIMNSYPAISNATEQCGKLINKRQCQ